MKLHRAGASPVNTFTGYGEGYVLVNGRRHESSVIVLPEQIVPWDVSEFSKITAADFEKLKTLDA
ncbi:MAG TPA: MTH938/NDUFAF3 family protein, partial [Burkholderiales bacterium]|nr:MTH938/NDUFAF3 family protein [Burkholderiales bacterium]